MTAKRLNDLAYVMYNRNLKRKYLEQQKKGDDIEREVLSEEDNEWVEAEEEIGNTSEAIVGSRDRPSQIYSRRGSKRTRSLGKFMFLPNTYIFKII